MWIKGKGGVDGVQFINGRLGQHGTNLSGRERGSPVGFTCICLIGTFPLLNNSLLRGWEKSSLKACLACLVDLRCVVFTPTPG